MSSIQPTPGRVVWYYPNSSDELATLNGQPLAAHVAAVHDDGAVNLAVLDANGTFHRRQRVALHDAFDETSGGGYATWMPYQLGQAAKTESVTMANIVPQVALAAAVVDVAVAAEAQAPEVAENVQTQAPESFDADTTTDSSGD